MIFAIAAVSLDLILGYGGMVSFGHAAYLGIGAYAVGILSFLRHRQRLACISPPAFVAAARSRRCVIGFVSLRTSGVYFIMITLAFGADGLLPRHQPQRVRRRRRAATSRGTAISAPRSISTDPVVFYYFAFGLLLLFLFLGNRIVQSRFGMRAAGVKSNERRMIALGFPTFRYKLPPSSWPARSAASPARCSPI